MTYRPWQRPAIRKAAIVVGLLILWEVVTRLGEVSPLLFPPASTVVASFLRSVASGEVPGYAGQSLQVLLTGMAIGGAIALVLTTLAVTTRLGAEFLQTVTAMFNPLPAIALMPLALLWFGLGVKSLIFVIIHSVLWPMSLNTYTGFVTVPPTLRRVGQNFGLSGWRLVAGILLPAAFPHILTGIKIGWAFAWRTIIAAEMVFGVAGSQGGLGWFIYQNRFEMNTDLVFAGLLTVILIGLLVENLFFRWLERKTVLRWGMSALALLATLLFVAPVEAQPTGGVHRIGFLSNSFPPTAATTNRLVDAFRTRLDQLGYREGQNLTLDFRYAEGNVDRLPALATELVQTRWDQVFAEAVRERADVVYVIEWGPYNAVASQIADQALRSRMPTLFGTRPGVAAGGLLAYGTNTPELAQRAAEYVDKILKGARPGDLPVEQARKFELVVNLKTAKTLGLVVPQSILLRADEVIR